MLRIGVLAGAGVGALRRGHGEHRADCFSGDAGANPAAALRQF